MNNLRVWRKQTNKTVRQIAEALNISESYFRDLETGRVRLNEDILNVLFEKFGITANYILNHAEEDLTKYNIVVDYVKNTNIEPEKLEKLLRHLIAMLKEYDKDFES